MLRSYHRAEPDLQLQPEEATLVRRQKQGELFAENAAVMDSVLIAMVPGCG